LNECGRKAQTASTLISHKGKCGNIEEFGHIVLASGFGKSGFVHLKATILQ